VNYCVSNSELLEHSTHSEATCEEDEEAMKPKVTDSVYAEIMNRKSSPTEE